VQMGNGDMIDFGYDATGTKTFSTHSTANSSSSGVTMPIGSTLKNNTAGITTHSSETVMYLDNMIYENWNLDKIQIMDGLLIRSNAVTATTPTFTYNYYVKDHLGNIRAVFHDAGNGTPIVDQVNNYYPFGMEYGESAEDTVAEDYQNYLFSGKEFDRKFEVNTYDYGARSYDATESHWLSIDPLAEKHPEASPYAYCNNNPVNRVDPDGRADFWLNGKAIGNDGVSNQKIYAIKTTEKDYNGVAGAGLSRKDQRATVDFIKANSGNAEAFQNNDIAYTNSIGIESSANNRQAMVNEVTRDNGNGGTSAANNREYGGSIENGKVVAATPGAVANPKTDATANILLPYGVPTFHSHPSGTIVDAPPSGTLDMAGTNTSFFIQSPSQLDINAAGTNTHYVFGRSAGVVYVYTANGIQAEIPMKQFVTPQK